MDKRIADDIKKVRKMLGLSQVELAKILKMPTHNITQYETGRAMPPTIKYLMVTDLGKEFAVLIEERKKLLARMEDVTRVDQP